MNKLRSLKLTGFAFLAALLMVVPFAGGVGRAYAAATATIPGDKLVLAFYYMWYSPASFSLGQMSDQPVAPYSSADPATVAQQIQQAKDAGIDAFISSWAGDGSGTDGSLPLLLDTASQNNFRVSLYIETNSVMQAGDFATQLQSAIAKYTSNSAYLTWNDKPVLFFWSPQSYGNAAAWRALRQKIDPQNQQLWSVDTTDSSYLDAFDTIHLFSGGKWTNTTNVAPVDAQWRATIDNYNKAHSTKRMWTAGVIPGWDESRVQPPRTGAKVFPRQNGAMYEQDWQAAIASNPEWITITSWNEWFEGTQIEPSALYGNQYLEITRKYTALWKGNAGSSPGSPGSPSSPSSPGSDPCVGGTYFAPTGHSTCKAMQAYWQQYGGLAQFGYPISDPMIEKSTTDGKDYTVQYFERARFELHPELSGTPYAVQLGLLGKQLHPTEAAVPAGDPTTSKYFPQTGHNVPLSFYNYWASHGGLFVNGYPISEPALEKSATDGKTYWVQYFERTRYELHQDASGQPAVLLGLLGTLAWAQRGGK